MVTIAIALSALIGVTVRSPWAAIGWSVFAAAGASWAYIKFVALLGGVVPQDDSFTAIVVSIFGAPAVAYICHAVSNAKRARVTPEN